MRIKTLSASTTAKLDKKANAFLARPDVSIRRIHTSMSFGTYMIVIEYEGH